MQAVKKFIDKIQSSIVYRNVVYYTAFYVTKLFDIIKQVYSKLSDYLVLSYRYLHRKISPHYRRYIKPHIDSYLVPIFENLAELLRPYYAKFVRPLLHKLQRILGRFNRPAFYWSIIAVVILSWGSIHVYFADPERLFSQVETGYQQSSALYSALRDTKSSSSTVNETSTEFIGSLDSNVNSLESSLDNTDFNPPNSFFMTYAFNDLAEIEQEIGSLESVNPQEIGKSLTLNLAQFKQLYSTVQPLLVNNEESLEINTISRNIEQLKSQPVMKTETINDEQVRVIVDAMAAELSQFYITGDRLALQMRIIELRSELATEMSNQWTALYSHHLIDVSALDSTYERMYFYLKPHIDIDN